MTDIETEESRAEPRSRPVLRVVADAEPDPGRPPDPVGAAGAADDAGARFVEALDAAERRARDLASRVERVRAELQSVEASLESRPGWSFAYAYAGTTLRLGVVALGAALVVLSVWARAVDYSLRVTSDTPTFLALVSGMGRHPLAEQSPFLDADVATQHATPYLQAVAFFARLLEGTSASPTALAGFLAVVGMAVFAFTLACLFVYARRLAGSTAAWVSIPVVLAVFGPPHVIWAGDLSLHAALYAGFFPQNVAMGTTLLALLVLGRSSRNSLIAATLLCAATMLVHPFTGVLLSVLVTVESCRLAVRRDRNAMRGPIALGSGFALGMLWPAYSLDRAFAETGMRGVLFVGLCIAATFAAWGVGRSVRPGASAAFVDRALTKLGSADAAFRLAVVGAGGTLAIGIWEWALVRSPPDESARLAIYWVDDRWRWPLLLIAGAVGISGLARLARRGQIVPAVWFSGCFLIGALGALGLPLPVWYRFLLLCQVPLAVGVAAVVAETRQLRTTALVAGTVVLAVSIKVLTLVGTPGNMTYFGQPLQPVWELADHIPRGPGLVATDPATAYFIPSTTGRHVLTVDKGHVSSHQELEQAAAGYVLLRRYYAGGPGWWNAGQEMWRRGVRYVVVAKQTTLEPATLNDFIWQTARLHTPAQRVALGNYFYENNRVGKLVFDSEDFAVYRLDRRKLFGSQATP